MYRALSLGLKESQCVHPLRIYVCYVKNTTLRVLRAMQTPKSGVSFMWIPEIRLEARILEAMASHGEF